MDSELNRNLVAQGERQRDIGMSLAADRRPDRVALGCLAMVDALLQSPDGTATIDAATPPDDLAAGFADGGRWRGTVTRTLVADGLVEIVGTTRSIRPSRHRGWLAVLSLTDRENAAAFLRRMTAFAANETILPVAADGVAMTDTEKNLGDLNDVKSV